MLMGVKEIFHFYLDIYVAHKNLSAGFFHVFKKIPESHVLTIIMSWIINIIHYVMYRSVKNCYVCS